MPDLGHCALHYAFLSRKVFPDPIALVRSSTEIMTAKNQAQSRKSIFVGNCT